MCQRQHTVSDPFIYIQRDQSSGVHRLEWMLRPFVRQIQQCKLQITHTFKLQKVGSTCQHTS